MCKYTHISHTNIPLIYSKTMNLSQLIKVLENDPKNYIKDKTAAELLCSIKLIHTGRPKTFLCSSEDQLIDDFIATNTKSTHSEFKTTGTIPFGKHKHKTVDEVAKTMSGRSYIRWMLAQNWMTSEKYPDIHAACTRLGLKKKHM